MKTRIPRIGIGGPVGCGKSMLIERVVPILAKKNYRVSIISVSYTHLTLPTTPYV